MHACRAVLRPFGFVCTGSVDHLVGLPSRPMLRVRESDGRIRAVECMTPAGEYYAPEPAPYSGESETTPLVIAPLGCRNEIARLGQQACVPTEIVEEPLHELTPMAAYADDPLAARIVASRQLRLRLGDAFSPSRMVAWLDRVFGKPQMLVVGETGRQLRQIYEAIPPKLQKLKTKKWIVETVENYDAEADEWVETIVYETDLSDESVEDLRKKWKQVSLWGYGKGLLSDYHSRIQLCLADHHLGPITVGSCPLAVVFGDPPLETELLGTLMNMPRARVLYVTSLEDRLTNRQRVYHDLWRGTDVETRRSPKTPPRPLTGVFVSPRKSVRCHRQAKTEAKRISHHRQVVTNGRLANLVGKLVSDEFEDWGQHLRGLDGITLPEPSRTIVFVASCWEQARLLAESSPELELLVAGDDHARKTYPHLADRIVAACDYKQVSKLGRQFVVTYDDLPKVAWFDVLVRVDDLPAGLPLTGRQWQRGRKSWTGPGMKPPIVVLDLLRHDYPDGRRRAAARATAYREDFLDFAAAPKARRTEPRAKRYTIEADGYDRLAPASLVRPKNHRRKGVVS